MRSALLPRTLLHLYQEHPALLLTLGYLFLTAVGMGYESLFFQQQGLTAQQAQDRARERYIFLPP